MSKIELKKVYIESREKVPVDPEKELETLEMLGIDIEYLDTFGVDEIYRDVMEIHTLYRVYAEVKNTSDKDQLVKLVGSGVNGTESLAVLVPQGTQRVITLNEFKGNTSESAIIFHVESNEGVLLSNRVQCLVEWVEDMIINIPQTGGYISLVSVEKIGEGTSKPDVSELGILSAKYESNGEPGTISGGGGDVGGASYGAYQFASKFDVPYSFVRWLENENVDYYNRLNNAYNVDNKSYGANFNEKWVEIANEDREGFLALQHAYTKTLYYDVTVEKLINDIGFDVNQHSIALQNVVWSRSVQHGASGGASRIKTAFETLDYNNSSEAELIRAIYAESGKIVDSGTNSITEANINNPDNLEWYINYAKDKGIYGKYMKYFSGNSTEVQVGVWKRLNIDELNDALEMLNSQ